MLPASNRGVGMNICFPDVCLTPAVPAPVPVPYPNIGMNAQATGFAPNVKVSGMNALNLGSKIAMTSGDEAGAAHPTIKGPGGWSMGNPIVSINKLPAINLTCLANGNNMNSPPGAAIVPSAVNVLYCDARGATARGAHDPAGRVLADARDAPEVLVAASGPDAQGVGVVALSALAADARVDVGAAWRALRSRGARVLVLDLRGCPGGDLHAALGLAAAFLPAGAALGALLDSDGDLVPFGNHAGEPDGCPLAVLVDGGTGSAAEVLAALLRFHGRAALVGATTFGKGSVQALQGAGAATRYVTVGAYRLPDGRAIDPGGLHPDVRCEPGDALAAARAAAGH